jgi:hypothetical protein
VDTREGQPVVDVVDELCEPIHGKGPYRIATDRFYTSVKCARRLLTRGLHMYGTCRGDRGVPKELRPKHNNLNLNPGEYICSFSDDVFLCTWRDSIEFHLLSTCHGAESGQVERRQSGVAGFVTKEAPLVAVDYNKNMGACDQCNALRERYSCRLSHRYRWYMTIVYYCIDILLTNAYIVYKISVSKYNSDHVDAITLLSHAEFIKEIVCILLRKCGVMDELQSFSNLFLPLHGKQHIVKYSATRKKCTACGIHCNFFCIACLNFLHPKHCFEEFHVSNM